MQLLKDINDIINIVFSQLGSGLGESEVEIIDRGKPHEPKPLPKNKRAVYIFLWGNQFLKIGKVGLNSNARFQSQHYNSSSSGSSLAKSILNDHDMRDENISEDTISTWIKTNCRRIDILIDSSTSIFTRDLIESLLHYKYEPKYEGYLSQRIDLKKLVNLSDVNTYPINPAKNFNNSNIDDKKILSNEIKTQNKIRRTKSGNPIIDEVRLYIKRVINEAFKNGQTEVRIRSGDIHKVLNMNSALPTVCRAMETLGDSYNYLVVQSPPQGRGTNLVHVYYK